MAWGLGKIGDVRDNIHIKLAYRKAMRKIIVEVELVNVEFLNSLKSFQFINEVPVTSSGPLHCVMKKCLTNYHAKNQEKSEHP